MKSVRTLWQMTACWALALVFLTAGCVRTTETRYYQLDMTPSGGAETKVHIEIDRLTVADDLARRDVLVQKDATEIEYYADAQWALSVPELVRRKLDAEFGRQPAGAPVITLDGEVRAFEQVDVAGGAEGRVTLYVRFRTDSEVVLRNTYTRQIPAATPTPKAVAEALSRALEEIAVEIAQDAAELAGG